VDSVDLQVLGPQEAHLLAKLLVDGTDDDAGSYYFQRRKSRRLTKLKPTIMQEIINY